MIYACPAWEFAADNYLLKLHRLQNKVLSIIDNLPRRIPTRDLHVGFRIPYLYDVVTKQCSSRQQSYKIMKMSIFTTLAKARLNIESNKSFKLGGG
jgi:hypothetical protein